MIAVEIIFANNTEIEDEVNKKVLIAFIENKKLFAFNIIAVMDNSLWSIITGNLH